MSKCRLLARQGITAGVAAPAGPSGGQKIYKMRELRVSRLLGRGCSGPTARGLMHPGAGVRFVPIQFVPVYNRLIPNSARGNS